MRKFLYLTCTLILFCFAQSSFAQVGVGTTTPNQSAALDVTATNRGVLLPRIALTAANNWSPVTGTATEGMIVYNTATAGAGINAVTPGFYYWYQSAWKPIGQAAATGSATFNCDNITFSAGLLGTTFTNGASYSGTITISYTNGDGGTYPPAAQIINGLTFVRAAGTFAVGSGQIVYNVSGTYTGTTGSTETLVMNLPGASCSKILPATSLLEVSNLNCQTAIPPTGTYTVGAAISGATKTVTLTPNAAGPYNITTNTVSGITFSASGNFTAGQVGTQQTVLLQASGTPTSAGLKTFIVTVGSQVCTFNLNFANPATFNCGSIVNTLTQAALVSGNSYSGSVTVPYTGGNGAAYPTLALTSNGLTLTRTPGSYAVGGGNVVYTLSGTYAGTGGAVAFTLPESGCNVYTGAATVNSISCGATPLGTYAYGTAMTSGNTKPVSFVANTIGYFTASTNTVNGVSFSSSGFAGSIGPVNTTMVATGTPLASGTYTYILSIGGATCSFGVSFTAPATFNCSNITNSFTGFLVNGAIYNATITQPYTAGNGQAYPAASLGPINGLTLSAPAGTYAAGGGTITYTLSGTYTGTTGELVSFQLPESGCIVNIGSATYVAGSLNCNGMLSGVYTALTPLTAANTKNITINVAGIGGYSITSNIVNNVTFSASGSFSVGGVQTIVLTGSGTPVSTGTFTYSLSIGGQNCTFSVNYVGLMSGLCGSVTSDMVGPLVNGNNYNITVTVPYIAGNGQPYGNFVSGPGNGLLLSREPGTYEPAGGNIIYKITGVYTGPNNGSQSFSFAEGCSILLGQPEIIPGSLTCAGALSGFFQMGVPTTGNTKIIGLANTSPGNYNVTSSNVAGISFSVNTTLSTTGSQTLTLNASGTPNQFGTFTYTITLDGQSCSFPVTILPPVTVNCNSIINGLPTPPLVSGTSYTGTVSEPYTAGNGQAYGSLVLNSNGLTLTRVAGTYAVGGGNVVYNIGGTYTGTANFVSFTLPENNCIVSSSAATLVAGTLSCLNPPGGTYTVGVPMNTSNSKQVIGATVNGGPITFTTNTVNGISFSAITNINASVGFSVTMGATGTPISAGTFNFTVTGGGQNCTFPVTFVSPVAFNCAGITTSLSGPLVNGTSYTGVTVTVPYTGGSGNAYSSNSVGPISGLTLTAPAGTYSGSGGSVVYTVSGTYTGITNGGAVFTLPESGCSVTLGTATFNPGTVSCGGALSGTYQVFVPVTAANTKVITVDVATPGVYNISTNVAAGIMFSASGLFTTTGVQNVTLVASGAPTASGVVPFTLTAGNQTCSFTVSIASPLQIICSGITHTLPGSLVNGTPYTGTVLVPYTSNNVGSYSTTTVTSNGLTLTRVAGSYAASGNIVYNLSGTFTGTSGTSTNFNLPDGGCVVAAGGGVYLAATLSCAPPLSGTYTQGIPLNASNTKSVSLSVISPGTWTGSTNTVNGVTFTGSGTFGGVNGQTAVLTGSGTPVASGTFTYAVTLNGQNCNFDVTYGTASFNCSGVVNTLPTLLINGNTYNTGSVSVPYTAGSGTVYTSTTVSSGGLTLTRVPGTYNAGGGNVVYNISGVWSGPTGGTVNFILPDGGCSAQAGIGTLNTPDCSGALAGTYEVGIPVTAANTKIVNINFVSPGVYNITSSNPNGVSFTSSGYVTTAGVHPITFVASGTPSNPGIFNYTVTAGGQTCSFPVNFIPPATFDCNTITGVPVAAVTTGVSYSATITLPYTSGNGTAYGPVVIANGGVSLQRTAGTFLSGGGNVVYTMSGTSSNPTGLFWTLPESGCIISMGNIQYAGNSLSCGGTLVGTYTTGVAMTSSNTKTISINVSGPGNYSASTNTMNGVTFAVSGNAPTTGVQDFVLTATGIPIASGTYYYTVNVGGQICSFGVTFQ